jgi:capsular exopolysaccharide synthesis family protein
VPKRYVGQRKRRGRVPDYIRDKPVSRFAEVLRNLRGRLKLNAPFAKVIMITSALSGEGKTSTAMSLARTMALSGDRVLLIDCDLRHNALGSSIETPPKGGLFELLTTEIKEQDVMVRDAVPGLDIIPIIESKFTPVDIFNGDRMEKMLNKWRHKYTYIILDTPPILYVADAHALAALADIVLLVARWKSTPRQAVQLAIEWLSDHGIVLYGVILTRVKVQSRSLLGYRDPNYFYSKQENYYAE